MDSGRFLILENDARYVDSCVSGDRWKKDHDQATAVWELEHLFRMVEVLVEDALRLDLNLHAESTTEKDAKTLDTWYDVLKYVLEIGRKALAMIEARAAKLQAAAYRDAVITPERARKLRAHVDEGLRAIGEWKAWKPPQTPSRA